MAGAEGLNCASVLAVIVGLAGGRTTAFEPMAYVPCESLRRYFRGASPAFQRIKETLTEPAGATIAPAGLKRAKPLGRACGLAQSQQPRSQRRGGGEEDGELGNARHDRYNLT